MTQPTEATTPAFSKDDAYARMAKAILRYRTVDQLVRAIKRDMESLPKDHVLARRSERVLKYMRGYIAAVYEEQALAIENYEGVIVAAHMETIKSVRKEKGTLGRVRRNGA